MKKVIYLADLMHSNFGLTFNTTPIGIGKIGTHVLKKFGHNNVEVRLFRTFEDIKLAVEEKTPDIMGLSSYAWNENLTAAAFRYFRGICPNTIFVTGGANISVFGWESGYHPSEKDTLTKQFSKALDHQTIALMPEVDFLVHGHGEYPVANIVEKLLGATSNRDLRGQAIDGCTGFHGEHVSIGRTPPFPADLDEFPSPYTTGLLDEMIKKYRLPAQLETNRGCPYQCSFCTTGGSYNKIAKHSFEYFKEELQWARDHLENKMLRLSDSNFGLFDKDVEIAEFIKEMQDRSGYPVAVRVYYSTIRANERTMKISKLLDRYQPFTISLQSETPIVLQNVVRRNNPRAEDLRKMVDFAHGNGLSVATDLISGMPGETYETFKETCETVVRSGFDSIYVNSLYLLKGSDLFTDAARKKYEYKTKFAMMANSVTKVDGEFIVEGEEYPVEITGNTEADFWKLYKLRIFMFMVFGGGYFKEIIMHLYTYGISFLDVYEHMLANPMRFPKYNHVLGDATRNAKEHKIFESMATLKKKVADVLGSQDPSVDKSVLEGMGLFFRIIYLLGDMLKEENKREFVREFVDATYVVAERAGVFDDEFREITEVLADLTGELMISPIGDKDEVVEFRTPYDLLAWADGNFNDKLGKHRLSTETSFFLAIRYYKEHQYVMEKSRELNDKDTFRVYYGQMNSSNMRRWIKPALPDDGAMIDRVQPAAVEMGFLR